MTPTRVIACDGCSAEKVALAAADVLAAGGLVIVPTDTVYGLAVRADDQAAVARVFAAKCRPVARALPVLLPDASRLDEVAATPGVVTRALAAALWPGPLTIVVPRSPRVPAWVTAGRDSVGLRVPNHALARAVLRLCDFPVAVTSANLSDEPTAATAAECAASLAEPADLVLEAGRLPGAASTVVEVVGDEIHVLREGPVTREAVMEALADANAWRSPEEDEQ